jgi:polar amino acid transport system substrate-binding protein
MTDKTSLCSTLFTFLALTFTSIFFSATNASPSFADVITVRADAWCPFNCVPKSDKPGYLIELLQESFKSEGTTIDYAYLAWTQAIKDVRTGKFDGIIAAAAEDAVGMIYTEKPQVTQNSCVFGLSSSKKTVRKAADLMKLQSLGTVKDYSYGDVTNKVLTSKAMDKIVLAIGGQQATETNLRRVLDKKIEAFMDDSSVINYYLNEHHVTNIKNLGCTEDRLPLWIAFTAKNPKSKAWVATLAAGQAALEKSGRLAEIAAKYGISSK